MTKPMNKFSQERLKFKYALKITIFLNSILPNGFKNFYIFYVNISMKEGKEN